MTLIRWTPLRDVSPWHPVNDLASEFANMQREIDRMFDRFRGGALEDDQTSLWLPAVDVVERDTDYAVKVELPGVNKEDVKITVQKDVLTIKGEKKQEQEKKGDNYHRLERSYGAFQRSFTLPSSVKSDKIEASYSNGVLTVTLPKVEEVKAEGIEVKVK
jgi:HSP20 family protein